MSHFTVLVVAKDTKDLHSRLIPFYEYGCSTDNDELVTPYLVFKSTEKEMREEYETETVERVVMPDGELVAPWDARFTVKGDHFFDSKQVIPENLEKREVKFPEIYPTFEEFAEEWHGSSKDPEHGYGYWHNPNAKWDWYQVGGRWEGLLLTKDGTDVDYAYAGEIDWDQMQNNQIAHNTSEWNHWENAMLKAGVTVQEFNATENDKEARKALYDKIKEASSLMTHDEHDAAIFFNSHGLTREQYLEKSKIEALTFAFIDYMGNWHQRGNMGWWAVVSDENSNYGAEFTDFIKSLDKDLIVYVVDCHI
jgi:hypothetical protein